MPTITRLPKKKSDYQKHDTNKDAADIYNTPQWKNLRKWKVSVNPLCEDCLDPNVKNEDGSYGEKITPTAEVHHIVPILKGSNELERKDYAYNPSNLCSLCVFHHHLRHLLMK